MDNVNWFPRAPNSRSIADGPLEDIWGQVDAVFGEWRFIQMSSGVSDTAIFLKPCSAQER